MKKVYRRRLESIKRKGGHRTKIKLEGKIVRIWSGEWRAYWREGGHGYTDGFTSPPWELPFEQAFLETQHCGPEKKIEYEVVV